jgi:hypothetical protein
MILALIQSDPADKNRANSIKPGKKTANKTSRTGIIG